MTYPTPVLLSDKIRVPPRARTAAGQACLLRAFERRFAARRRLRDVKPEEVEAWIGRYLLDETTSMRSLWTCASKDKSLAAHARQLEARWYFHAAWLYGLMRQKKEAESWAAKGCALLPRPWCANGLPKNSYFRFDAKDVIKP